MIPVFVIGLALSLVASAPLIQERAITSRIIRVHVKTDDQFDRDQLDGRKLSVKDLAEALRAKKKTLSVVNEEAGADVIVDIVDRAISVPKVVLGIGARPGEAPGGTAPLKNAVLRVRLSVGEAVTDLANRNRAPDNPRGWKSAAEDLADQIDKWILSQRGKLIR